MRGGGGGDGTLSLATCYAVTCEPVLEVHDRVEDGIEGDGEEGPALGLHQQQVTRHLGQSGTSGVSNSKFKKTGS